jgi:hypothetical protein
MKRSVLEKEKNEEERSLKKPKSATHGSWICHPPLLI